MGGAEELERQEKKPVKFLLRESAYHQKLLSTRNSFAIYARTCTVAHTASLSLILRAKVAITCRIIAGESIPNHEIISILISVFSI